jgi:DNA-binding response OmpR family regulator
MRFPDMPGSNVLRFLLDFTDAPVIVISGKDTSESISQALTIGTDDYIARPFVPIELLARVNASTR